MDEFPHTNVGSERAKRWEDVQVLLDAGIDVLTTMNIQHLESLNDQVWHITGIRVRETIPDWVVQQADEVVMTDVTPRALCIGCSAAWCTGKRKPNAPWRISFASRPWLPCVSWRSGKRPTKWSSVQILRPNANLGAHQAQQDSGPGYRRTANGDADSPR